MRYDQLLQREAAITWLMNNKDSFTLAVTLTLKQKIKHMTDTGHCYEHLDTEKASKNLKHFINRLNAEFFGNNAKRNQKSIKIAATLEGKRTGKLLHYHCAIGGLPTNISEQCIRNKFMSAWHMTQFGNEQVHVQEMTDERWLKYICKEVGYKYADVVDYENLHF